MEYLLSADGAEWIVESIPSKEGYRPKRVFIASHKTGYLAYSEWSKRVYSEDVSVLRPGLARIYSDTLPKFEDALAAAIQMIGEA